MNPHVLADGIITEDERDYLKSLLSELIGGTTEETGGTSGVGIRFPLMTWNNIQVKGRLFLLYR